MSAQIQPVHFYVPESSAEPIEVAVPHSGLRMVLVNRESVGLLDSSWGVLGVYFLLGPSDDPDRYRAYVGEVGKRTLLMRVREHARQKEWWSRALLIASASDELHSAEIGWLEGRLYDVLNNAIGAEVMNRGRPGDDSIALRDRGPLERYIEPIMAVLRACGASPDTADQKPEPKGRRRPRRYTESVSDLIGAGLLKVGTRLVPLRRGLEGRALVCEDGSLEVDGTRFAHVSPAAQAVSGSVSEPGWDFWGAPSGDGGFVPLAKLRERLRENGSKGVSTGPESSSRTQALIVEERSAPTPMPHSRPAKSKPRPDGRPARRGYALKMKDLIDAGDLVPGEQLIGSFHGERYETVLLPDGCARGLNGETDQSVSTAAKLIAGKAKNGWDFWSVIRDGRPVKLAKIRAQRIAANTSAEHQPE